jgi:hypothetical protein
MTEWHKCRNLPLLREYRKVEPDETGVETLEGYSDGINPETHFIMKGVKGELYPIRKDIYETTYEHVDRYNEDEKFLVVTPDDIQTIIRALEQYNPAKHGAILPSTLKDERCRHSNLLTWLHTDFGGSP